MLSTPGQMHLSRFTLQQKNFVQVHVCIFFSGTLNLCPVTKEGECLSSGGTTARNMARAVLPTDVVVPTGQSVPPLPALPAAPPDAGALEASITLASLSMPAHAAGVLATTQGEPLAGSTETSATFAMVAVSTAVPAQDLERLRRQAAAKKVQRAGQRALQAPEQSVWIASCEGRLLVT